MEDAKHRRALFLNAAKKELEGYLVYENMDYLGKIKKKKEMGRHVKEKTRGNPSFQFLRKDHKQKDVDF
jgi:hypothetical protein